MPRRRVAILNPSAVLGGAEFGLLELLSRLQSAYEFHLVMPSDGPLRSGAEQAGAQVKIVPWPAAVEKAGERDGKLRLSHVAGAALRVPASARSLSRGIRDLRPSLVVTNGIKSHFLGTLALLGNSIPVVWYVRDSLDDRPVSRRLLYALRCRCDAVACASRFLAEELRGTLGPSLPVYPMYDIVDLRQFRPAQPLPEDLRKPEGEMWFGVVGALTSYKGQDLFLRAARNIADRIPRARFLVIGANPYDTDRETAFAKSLLELARTSGLSDRTHFLGFRRDAGRIVSNLDVLVHPNRGPEGLGRVVIEAMACSVPVITVDRWGPGELITHEVNGLTLAPGDLERLTAHMMRLAEDADLRKRLGANGRRWVEANMRPEALAAQFDELLQSVMGGRRGRRLGVPSDSCVSNA